MKPESLLTFLENLAELFGSNCEIVLHDFRNDAAKPIVKIINGHVTGRNENSPLTSLYYNWKSMAEQKDGMVYYNTTPFGQTLKCCTSLLRDDDGEVIGAICVNYDVTDLVRVQKTLDTFAHIESIQRVEKKEAYFDNVDELLDYFFRQCEENAGKSVSEMSKDEKMSALKWMDDKGIMRISKAGNRICEFFGFSKYTLYSYLEKIRNTSESNQGIEEI